QRKLKRLYPKIKPLLTQILSWRIEDNADDYPPGFPRNELRKVQDTYKDAEEYAQVFELLRMLECWGQFQNAMTVTTGTEVAKASVQGVMRHSAVRSIIVMVDTAEAQVFQENDIVVGSQAPGQGAIIRGATQARAGVEEMQRNSGMSYFHRISGRSTFLGLVKSIVPGTRVTRMVVSAQLDKPGDAQAMDTRVVLGTEWELCKLLSVAPLQREYAALQSLKYLEDSIVKDILQPRAIPPPQVLSDKEIAQVMRAHELNRPQAEAVATAMKREDGFTLIHGPPGTGKTKTIVGLVGALLSKPETEKDQTKRKRLLICAPSNAAVDVIVERLAQDGVRDSNGNTFYPRVVRVGQIGESSTSVVRNSALDTRVDTLLGNPSVADSDPDEVESGEDAGEQEQEEGGEWDLGEKGEQLSGGASGRLRDRMRRRVLWDADVVCATLSTSGGRDLLKAGRSLTFETVIIDEAAQSNELTCLIPLKYGCKRCIMVGDPYQLPPTIFSHVATAHLYKQSMFLRLQKNAPEEVARMLSIQYRMHPEISTLPSRLFYEAQLMDGPQLAAKRVAPWHRSLEKYAPYAFFDIASGKEKKGAAYSVYNMAEVTAAIQLVHNLITDHPDIAWGQRIGIITPYRRQLHKLVDEFVRHFGPSVREAIEFNTVDGFQGKEKDVVIFSCVRAGTNNIGFLADRHRMNVGLTRARRSLFVLGNAKQLVSSPLWEILVDDAQRRGVLNRCALPLFGWKPQPMGRMPAPLQRHDGDTSGGGASEFELEEIDANSQQLLNNSGESVVEAGSTPPSAMSQPRDSGIPSARSSNSALEAILKE
ncbi:DEAD-box type RNA helicase, partial [Coemansia sp. RSA 1933]